MTPVPGSLSARMLAASITEFAYLTPRGEPLCWPVTPYWYADRGVLGISTGLAYPNKAYYARRHPQVAALFGGTLLQGDAVVLDEDLQTNTDRYIREMRAKFVSARIGLNPISVRMLDFYLPRLWIEVTPARVLDAAATPAVADGHSPAAGPPAAGNALGPGAAREALTRWVRRLGRSVIALPGADGYPVLAPVGVAPGPDGSVDLVGAPGTGPAALTLHTQGLGGVRLDALMARGWVVDSGTGLRFVPRRVVGFLGREASMAPALLGIFPLSQLPRAATLRRSLREELSRRGEPLPRLRVPR